jgi:hypothetical protein
MFANNEWAKDFQMVSSPFVCDSGSNEVITIIWPDMSRERMASQSMMQHVAFPVSKIIIPDYIKHHYQGEMYHPEGLFYFKNEYDKSIKGCLIEIVYHSRYSTNINEVCRCYWYIPTDERPEEVGVKPSEDAIIEKLLSEGKFLKLEEFYALRELS